MNAEYVITAKISATPGHVDVSVRTIRQFSSFGYGISLTANTRRDLANGYVLDIGGITLPQVSKQAEGSAESSVAFPIPSSGTLSVSVRRKDAVADLVLHVVNGTLTAVDVTSTSALFIVETPAA
jgi:hypothetical protein